LGQQTGVLARENDSDQPFFGIFNNVAHWNVVSSALPLLNSVFFSRSRLAQGHASMKAKERRRWVAIKASSGANPPRSISAPDFGYFFSEEIS
jgi:hypothetical protein